MKRDRVLDATRKGLAKTGFFLSHPHGARGLCFDLVARRDDTLLIVKVLQNVDGLNKETARELLDISRILEGSPIVVGERSGTGPLEDGVLYSPLRVAVLSPRTLADFRQERVPPFPFPPPCGPVAHPQRLGFAVLPTARSPFDALSSRATTTLLTGVGDADSALDRKAEIVSNISRVVEKDSVMFVVRRPVRMTIRGIPVIAREELRRMKDSDFFSSRRRHTRFDCDWSSDVCSSD